MFTVITMWRGRDAAIFIQLVAGRLTEEQRQKWRETHDCDIQDEDDHNDMFFREFETPVPNGETDSLLNADGDTYKA